eukprot:1182207-Amphidinium_carterae.1
MALALVSLTLSQNVREGQSVLVMPSDKRIEESRVMPPQNITVRRMETNMPLKTPQLLREKTNTPSKLYNVVINQSSDADCFRTAK